MSLCQLVLFLIVHASSSIDFYRKTFPEMGWLPGMGEGMEEVGDRCKGVDGFVGHWENFEEFPKLCWEAWE